MCLQSVWLINAIHQPSMLYSFLLVFMLNTSHFNDPFSSLTMVAFWAWRSLLGIPVEEKTCLMAAFWNTGITGILCSRFCREVVLTDHNDEVLKARSKI